jgi:protein-disulfide isomerase
VARLRVFVPALLSLVLSCASQSYAPESRLASSSAPLSMPPPERDASEPQPSSDAVPVDVDDAVWGKSNAPVTIVVFTDLECPYCAEGHATIRSLTRRFGHERISVVVKHCPLAMHSQAIPAARVAQAVLELAGRRKFFEYLDLVYANPHIVAAGGVLELAGSLGLEATRVRTLAASEEIGEQIVEDVQLANRMNVAATPHFRINGLPMTGAVPFEMLEAVIQTELVEAERLRRAGVAANRVYANRVARNIARPAP